jgi:hypothetical protein
MSIFQIQFEVASEIVLITKFSQLGAACDETMPMSSSPKGCQLSFVAPTGRNKRTLLQ